MLSPSWLYAAVMRPGCQALNLWQHSRYPSVSDLHACGYARMQQTQRTPPCGCLQIEPPMDLEEAVDRQNAKVTSRRPAVLAIRNRRQMRTWWRCSGPCWHGGLATPGPSWGCLQKEVRGGVSEIWKGSSSEGLKCLQGKHEPGTGHIGCHNAAAVAPQQLFSGTHAQPPCGLGTSFAACISESTAQSHDRWAE